MTAVVPCLVGEVWGVCLVMSPSSFPEHLLPRGWADLGLPSACCHQRTVSSPARSGWPPQNGFTWSSRTTLQPLRTMSLGNWILIFESFKEYKIWQMEITRMETAAQPTHSFPLGHASPTCTPPTPTPTPTPPARERKQGWTRWPALRTVRAAAAPAVPFIVTFMGSQRLHWAHGV